MCTRQETDDAKVKDVLTESLQLPIIPSVLTTVTGLQAVAAEKISAELMSCFFIGKKSPFSSNSHKLFIKNTLFFHSGSSRSGSGSARAQGSAGGPTGSGRQGGPGSQTDGAPGQRAQLQQQAQTSATRPGQPGATTTNSSQQQPQAQGQGMGMGMGMGMGQGQAKPGQMGPAGGPMGQARQTGPTGTTTSTIVSPERKDDSSK